MIPKPNLKNSSGPFKMGNNTVFQSFISGALGVFRFGTISVKEAGKRELEEYFTKSHTDFKNAFDNLEDRLEDRYERNKKVFRE
jgi:hypothetical protein